MGDMGDIFREINESKKVERAARSTQAMSMINDVKGKVDSLTVDGSGTWNITKGVHKLQFYPTKGTWQYKKRMFRGGIFSFINWLEKL